MRQVTQGKDLAVLLCQSASDNVEIRVADSIHVRRLGVQYSTAYGSWQIFTYHPLENNGEWMCYYLIGGGRK